MSKHKLPKIESKMHSELRVWLTLCQNVCLCLQVFTREELEMVAELCKKYDVICLMDEVYEWLIYSGTKHVRMGETSIMTSSLNPLTLLYNYTSPSLVARDVGENHHCWECWQDLLRNWLEGMRTIALGHIQRRKLLQKLLLLYRWDGG